MKTIQKYWLLILIISLLAYWFFVLKDKRQIQSKEEADSWRKPFDIKDMGYNPNENYGRLF